MPASTNSFSEPPIWVVILAGGVGSRFWPVSTPRRPKQLLPLAGDLPLIRQTVDRIRPMVNDDRIRILTGERLAQPLLAAVPGLGPSNLLLEPEAKGTAPVLTWAAHEILRRDANAVIVSLHADHVIEPAESFRTLLQQVARAAVVHERLFTIGAVPTRAETGYGYIRCGATLPGEEGLYDVGEFVEKPRPEVAERFVREGYIWNTGLFVWPASLFLAEVRRHTPEIAAHLSLLDSGRIADFFARVPTLTVDTGVLERSRRVAVARATFHWDDVGAWDAVARTRTGDAHGNVAMGDAHLIDSKNCVAWADAGSIVVFGGEDLVVVRTAGTTFVAPRSRSADLKRLLAQLPERLQRPEDS